MGRSLTTDVGLGIQIPVDESGRVLSLGEDEIDYDLEDEDEDFDEQEDLYERFEAIEKEFPLLSAEYGYSEDFVTGAAILIKRLCDTGYYEPATIAYSPDKFVLTSDEETQLRAVAERFKVDFELKIIAVPSYG